MGVLFLLLSNQKCPTDFADEAFFLWVSYFCFMGVLFFFADEAFFLWVSYF